MTGDNWGQMRGQTGDTGDTCLVPTGDTGDKPPRRVVPCPRKGPQTRAEQSTRARPRATYRAAGRRSGRGQRRRPPSLNFLTNEFVIRESAKLRSRIKWLEAASNEILTGAAATRFHDETTRTIPEVSA